MAEVDRHILAEALARPEPPDAQGEGVEGVGSGNEPIHVSPSPARADRQAKEDVRHSDSKSPNGLTSGLPLQSRSLKRSAEEALGDTASPSVGNGWIEKSPKAHPQASNGLLNGGASPPKGQPKSTQALLTPMSSFEELLDDTEGQVWALSPRPLPL